MDLANSELSTPLVIAAEDGHAPVVQLLLDAKASTTSRDKDGDTALDVARIRPRRVRRAARPGPPAPPPPKPAPAASPPAEAEEAGGAASRRRRRSRRRRSRAVEHRREAGGGGEGERLKQLKELLGARTIVVDYQDVKGWSALMLACFEGHEVAVRMLLEAKATVDLALTDESALYLASEGAPRLRAAAARGEGAVDARDSGSTPLFIACQEGHVARLLLEAKAAVDRRDTGATPLFAVALGSWSARGCVKAKASVDHTTNKGVTPLMAAAEKGREPVVRCCSKPAPTPP